MPVGSRGTVLGGERRSHHDGEEAMGCRLTKASCVMAAAGTNFVVGLDQTCTLPLRSGRTTTPRRGRVRAETGTRSVLTSHGRDD